ncbi:methyl-accepting chemotaxis protein [Rhizobium sp. L9]|uniref:methyl-accepting chemotaxis protein n=1 Tax=Rhizobium TaxID=379 RepID=UPI000BEA2364|nr:MULTISPECIES: methyl-accepting chemotaxis protein [unclassified Rhizobium]MDC9813192.1 methyl-accepting chemotaxis protein [Rhizobium sp. MC62]PDT26996.1 methyl-accepting chemotaxis protein [Rhizobium sp. L9]
MSFLENVSIKLKMLLLVAPVCAIGITGLTFVSLKYRYASQSYVSFIAEDEAAAIQMARASQRLTALSYNAYQVMSYDTKDPNIKKFALYYENNKAKLLSELRAVKKLAPDQKESIDGFISAANGILELTNGAVQLALKGDTANANALLRRADPIIADQVLAVRDWTDGFASATALKSQQLADSADKTSFYSLVTIAVLFASLLAVSIFIASRYVTLPMVRLRDRMMSLADGNTGDEVLGEERRDELGSMARAVSVFRKNAIERTQLEHESELVREAAERDRQTREGRDAADAGAAKFAVSTLGAALQRLSDGDLTHRIETPFRADLDSLRFDYNASVEKLLGALLSVNQNAFQIDSSCEEIRSASHDLSTRTERQAASLEETAAAVGQVTSAIRENAIRADEAKVLVAQAKTGAEASGVVVRSAVEAMRNIEKSSDQITTIIEVIDEIAFQTNLLALNAGVEASRAGDAGRGFAVVAQEVRELAQRSATAAREIKQLISSASAQVEKGVSLVDETGKSLGQIIAEVTEIDRHVVAIAWSAQEQAITLANINATVGSIDNETQKNAAMAEQSAAAGSMLASQAEALTELLCQFKIHQPVAEDDNLPASDDGASAEVILLDSSRAVRA